MGRDLNYVVAKQWTGVSQGILYYLSIHDWNDHQNKDNMALWESSDNES